MELGERIRTLRLRRGVSQADLEKQVGVKRSYISRVEGRQVIPSLETLSRIARALGAELPELFSRVSEADDTDEASLRLGHLSSGRDDSMAAASAIDDLCDYKAVPLQPTLLVKAKPVFGNCVRPLPYPA